MSQLEAIIFLISRFFGLSTIEEIMTAGWTGYSSILTTPDADFEVIVSKWGICSKMRAVSGVQFHNKAVLSPSFGPVAICATCFPVTSGSGKQCPHDHWQEQEKREWHN